MFPALRRGRPLEAGQRREIAGLVVVARGLDLDVLPGAASLSRARQRTAGAGVRAAVVVDHVLQEPGALLVTFLEVAQLDQHRVVIALRARDLRRVHFTDELGVVGDGDEVERPADVVLLAVDVTSCALRELIGIVRRDTGAADEGVERVGRVHVRLAEVGVLQRILRRRGLELLYGRGVGAAAGAGGTAP